MNKQKLVWDLGTAYDLFISLHVLHNPDRFGLRGSWAAGVRSRLPVDERKILEKMDLVFWIPVHWIQHLQTPKDGQIVLSQLGKIRPGERLVTLAMPPSLAPEISELLQEVEGRGSWTEAEFDRLRSFYKTRGRPIRQGQIETILDVWASAAEFGEGYLRGLSAYYEVFFAEEERRILPALRQSLERSQQMAARLDDESLLAELSQGVHFEAALFQPGSTLVLIPSYWSTPLVIYDRLGENSWFIVFGGRPVDASLVPGEFVPDTMLQALKTLADPTRLRILRYLSDKPMTPTQLARHLRLRAPTVVHHLSELRLAGLVHLTIENSEKKSERRYAARLESIPKLFDTLQAFLLQEDLEIIEAAEK
jgi:DNA-binding transcriptional ArsR family regulator